MSLERGMFHFSCSYFTQQRDNAPSSSVQKRFRASASVDFSWTIQHSGASIIIA
ncbi:uncharacterized protein FFNC_15672 [Fusarium fujikuroi]|nr:uncharacterized protein FFNC_15672 [Fusarium fujikuroi]